MSESMITRTMTGANVTVLAVKASEQTTEQVTYYLKGVVKSDDKALRAIKRDHDTNDVKHVAVVSIEPVNLLYGMPESKFFELAEALPDVQAKREEYAASKAAKLADAD